MTELRMPYRLFWLIKDKCDEESAVRMRRGPQVTFWHTARLPMANDQWQHGASQQQFNNMMILLNWSEYFCLNSPPGIIVQWDIWLWYVKGVSVSQHEWATATASEGTWLDLHWAKKTWECHAKSALGSLRFFTHLDSARETNDQSNFVKPLPLLADRYDVVGEAKHWWWTHPPARLLRHCFWAPGLWFYNVACNCTAY